MMTVTRARDFELFGDRLECAMARVDIRQTELAVALGVRPQAISFLVNGDSLRYHGDHGLQMAEMLGVSEVWLVRNEGEPPADMPRPQDLAQGKKPTKISERRRLARAKRGSLPADRESGLPAISLRTDVVSLNHLQLATLEKLSNAMRAGIFSDAACLEILLRLEKSESSRESMSCLQDESHAS